MACSHHNLKKWRSNFFSICISISLTLSLVFFSHQSAAQSSSEISILYEAPESEKYSGLIQSLEKKLGLHSAIRTDNLEIPKSNLVISIGYDNFVHLLDQKLDNPVLVIAISSTSYYDAVSKTDRRKGITSAIFLEPYPEKQLRLIRNLSGEKKSEVTFLYSKKTAFLRPILESASAKIPNLSIHYEEVVSSDDVYRLINSNTSKWVLAYPDKNIYNQGTIKNILLSLYRKNQALIGFSQALVTAGAVGSAISSNEDVVLQTQEYVTYFAKYGRLQTPDFLKYSTYTVNEAVAHSINIDTSNVKAGQKNGN